MKTKSGNLLGPLLVGAMACSLATPLSAQEAGQGGSSVASSNVSAQAQAVLARMTGFMQGLESFSIESRSTRDELLAYGYTLQNNERASLVVQRPNKLRSEVSGDVRDRTFVYDGSKLVIYSPDDQAYATVGAPSTLAALVSGILDAGIEFPLIDVLAQSAAGTLTSQVSSGILVGSATIDGIECDHLAFRQADTDWQLWVAKGAQPLPRRILITTRYEVGNPQFEATLDWNLKPKITPGTFAFVAPKGAVEIPFDRPAALVGQAQ